jgi:glutamate 5-kinase
MEEDGKIVGVAKVRLGSAQITESLSLKNVMTAHADDIVMF